MRTGSAALSLPNPAHFSHFFLPNDFSPLSRSLEQAITDRTFITLRFEMLLQMGPFLHLGPVVTLVPSTGLFRPYPILFIITLNAMHVAFSAIIFFLRITACRIFFRQVSLPGLIFRKLSPHLRLFLMPSVPHWSYSETKRRIRY